ncbi:MAG: arginine--tRNA ligase [Allosphingosinicella sp.]
MTILEQLPEPLRKEVAAIDFRRSPMGVADAVVVFHRCTPNIDDLPRLLFGSKVFESVVRKSHELKVRLRDEIITDLRADMAPVAPAAAVPTKVRVAFCDPNLNKALHAGHLRNIAIGHAAASLWRYSGAAVTTQSVACDIGRNMAEALAGLEQSGMAEQAFAGRLDRRVGQLYAEYVQAAGVDEQLANRADQVISRELQVHRDEADDYLTRWRTGEPQARALWAKVVDRMLREQAETLDRLGVAFDRVVLESNALTGEAALVDELTRLRMARAESSGAVLIETGREDYPHCPLRRSDGFPTEHLRALSLWRDLAREAYDLTIHVMGDEWRTSTEVRVAILDRLQDTKFAKRYAIVTHALVRFNSSTMKSSSGNVLLIDDVLDAISRRAESADACESARPGCRGIRAAALIPLLAMPADRIIDLNEATFTETDTNLGWQLACTATRAGDDRAPGIDPRCPVERYLALQTERLCEAIPRAARANDPFSVVRACRHLLEIDKRFELSARAQLWRATLIDEGMCALGIKR